MVCNFMFGTHLIHLPIKWAKENIYTAPNTFLLFSPISKISSENVKSEPCQKTYPVSAIPWWEAVSMGEWCREPHTQQHTATLLGEPQVLLYTATKFAEYYIQVKTLYIHKCSIPKAPLSVWSCIALVSYKDT